MKVLFDRSTDKLSIDRVKTIKAFRSLFGMSLKYARDSMDETMSKGELDLGDRLPHFDPVISNTLKSFGFTIHSDHDLMLDALNHVLDLATVQRNYTVISLTIKSIEDVTGQSISAHQGPMG